MGLLTRLSNRINEAFEGTTTPATKTKKKTSTTSTGTSATLADILGKGNSIPDGQGYLLLLKEDPDNPDKVTYKYLDVKNDVLARIDADVVRAQTGGYRIITKGRKDFFVSADGSKTFIGPTELQAKGITDYTMTSKYFPETAKISLYVTSGRETIEIKDIHPIVRSGRPISATFKGVKAFLASPPAP